MKNFLKKIILIGILQSLIFHFGCSSDDVAIVTATTGQYSIVDTNQTVCYQSNSGATTACTGIGHDADYTRNAPSYTATTVSGGKMVTDNVTGLTWTQSTDIDGSGQINYADKKSQSDAVSYCSDLSLGDQTDWRLPSVKEAYSLILFSGTDASNYTGTSPDTDLTLFIDTTVFDRAYGDKVTSAGITAGDRIIDAQYASTTIYVSTTMSGDKTMFGVNYVDGRIKGYPALTKLFYVRCVRGNTSYGTNVYVDNGDSTVSDSATGLMWHQNDTASTNYDNAVSTCEASSLASQTDWRLPNTKELQSIVDYSRSPDTSSNAAIDAMFNSTSFTNEEGIADWGYYWASTTHVEYSSSSSNDVGRSATYVSFGRALGYMPNSILDVHGAGSQRSNWKNNVSSTIGASSRNDGSGLYYYKGPQGDILRQDNKIRCVRTI